MLWIAFLFATVLLFLQTLGAFPSLCHAYLPWIALAILRHPLRTSPAPLLAVASCAGAILDLLSDLPLGLYPVSYALTAAILFRCRSPFLYEQPWHFALFTSLASLFSSLLQLFFLFLFDRRVAFSEQWIFMDWIGASAADGAYALIGFFGPIAAASKIRRTRSLFWFKKKHSRA